MGEIINLFTDGEVSLNGDRTFTRLMGGFGENKVMFLIWQASELLGQESRELVQNFERNVDKFKEYEDYVDLKSLINENDKRNHNEFSYHFSKVLILPIIDTVDLNSGWLLVLVE